MQLYALDNENRLVYASNALKQQNYCCLECQQPVRVRKGHHRKTHYFHLTSNQPCRLNGKSMAHLQTQFYIQSMLPSGEARLEWRFESISRIADVVWMSKKIVFEIQCSPMSVLEMENRNRDYAREGFHVIWILHDNRYNQRFLTSLEQRLSGVSFYFTNINAQGKGIVYDQFALIHKQVRKQLLPPLSVDLSTLHVFADREYSHLIPKLITQRKNDWPYFFRGDLTDLAFDVENGYIKKVMELERGLKKFCRKRDLFKLYVLRPYRLLFQAFLERACK